MVTNNAGENVAAETRVVKQEAAQACYFKTTALFK